MIHSAANADIVDSGVNTKYSILKRGFIVMLIKEPNSETK
jgi:hypothetical protein